MDLLAGRPPAAARGHDLALELTPAARALIVRDGHGPGRSGRGRSSGRSSGWSRTRSRGRSCRGHVQARRPRRPRTPTRCRGRSCSASESRHRRGRGVRATRRRGGPAADREAAGCRRRPSAVRPAAARRADKARTAASSSTSAPQRVRFEEAVRRLEPLPDVLPDGPEALIPVFADTGSSRPRPAWGDADASARPAAVLVLVFPDEDGEARLVLTERVDRGGHHSGEVSFPGGSAEARRRRPRRDRAPRGGRGGGPRPGAGRRPGARRARDAVDPGEQLHGDAGRRGRGPSAGADPPADRGGAHPGAAGGRVPPRRRAADRRAGDPRLAACATRRTPWASSTCGG